MTRFSGSLTASGRTGPTGTCSGTTVYTTAPGRCSTKSSSAGWGFHAALPSSRCCCQPHAPASLATPRHLVKRLTPSRAPLLRPPRIPEAPSGASYYSFSPYEGFRFVVLDCYDLSARRPRVTRSPVRPSATGPPLRSPSVPFRSVPAAQVLGWPEGHPKRERALQILRERNPNDNKNSPEGLHVRNKEKKPLPSPRMTDRPSSPVFPAAHRPAGPRQAVRDVRRRRERGAARVAPSGARSRGAGAGDRGGPRPPAPPPGLRPCRCRPPAASSPSAAAAPCEASLHCPDRASAALLVNAEPLPRARVASCGRSVPAVELRRGARDPRGKGSGPFACTLPAVLCCLFVRWECADQLGLPLKSDVGQAHSCVVLTLAGHTHADGYSRGHDGVHHRVLSVRTRPAPSPPSAPPPRRRGSLRLSIRQSDPPALCAAPSAPPQAVLECPPGTVSFGHMDVFVDRIVLHGVDRMASATFAFERRGDGGAPGGERAAGEGQKEGSASSGSTAAAQGRGAGAEPRPAELGGGRAAAGARASGGAGVQQKAQGQQQPLGRPNGEAGAHSSVSARQGRQPQGQELAAQHD